MNISNIYKRFAGCFIMLLAFNSHSSEIQLNAAVNVSATHDDNIFLTSGPHDNVSGFIVTPTLAGVIKEKHWEAVLDARLRNSHYSDKGFNGTDQYFGVTGKYSAERNIFSLNVSHDLDSNLSSTSSDFGIVGRRINREMQSISPQYTYLLTERLMMTLTYSYTDVDYFEAENTSITPYVTESIVGSFSYSLTERDRLTFSQQGVDYASSDDLIKYKLFSSRFGIDHKFSETLSSDFLVGISRQSTTNLRTQVIDFSDTVILTSQIFDAKNKSFVLDAGITNRLERGSISVRLSRNNTTNSIGGLDQIDRLDINYKESLSSLWKYVASARFEDITSVGSNSSSSDRDVLFLEAKVNYSITSNWSANASYRYIQRKFKSDTSDSRAPHSNKIYIGMTYNFPTLSTF